MNGNYSVGLQIRKINKYEGIIDLFNDIYAPFQSESTPPLLLSVEAVSFFLGPRSGPTNPIPVTMTGSKQQQVRCKGVKRVLMTNLALKFNTY